jgi:hypothetical protein
MSVNITFSCAVTIICDEVVEKIIQISNQEPHLLFGHFYYLAVLLIFQVLYNITVKVGIHTHRNKTAENLGARYMASGSNMIFTLELLLTCTIIENTLNIAEGHLWVCNL